MESNNEEKSLGNECVARLAVIAFSRSFRSRAVYYGCSRSTTLQQKVECRCRSYCSTALSSSIPLTSRRVILVCFPVRQVMFIAIYDYKYKKKCCIGNVYIYIPALQSVACVRTALQETRMPVFRTRFIAAHPPWFICSGMYSYQSIIFIGFVSQL